MGWFERELYFRRKRRAPDPYRVMYFDMETLRAGKLRNWDDTSGTRDGTISGMTIAGTGMPAKSGYFDGDGYVSIGAFGLSGTALTFTAWVRCTFNSTINQAFIGDGAQSGTVGFLYTYRELNSNSLVWQYATGSVFAVAVATGYFSGYNDTWVHVAVVCDYANKVCKFYRNCMLHTTVSPLSGTPVFPSASRTRYLGAYNPTVHRLTNGYMDEVQLWTRALSDAEVLEESRRLPALP